MDEKELKAIFEQLETEGWQPRLCDTNLPFYDRSVPCGEPNEIGDDTSESILQSRGRFSLIT